MEYPAIQLVRPHRYNSLMMLHLCSTTQTIPHHSDCHMNFSLVSASMTRTLFKSAVSQPATPPTEVIKSVTWNDVRLATSSEPSMCQLIEMIQEGFSELPSDLPMSSVPTISFARTSQSLTAYASTTTVSSFPHPSVTGYLRRCTVLIRVSP